MRIARVLVAALILVGVVACSDPSSKLVGTWKGTTSIQRPPSGNDKLDHDLASQPHEVMYEVELRKDNTYTEKMGLTKIPKVNVIEGKWSLQGQVLTLNPTSVNGEDPAKLKADQEQMMNRMHITLPLPEGSDGPKYVTASSDFSTLSFPSIGATAQLKKG